MEEWKDIIGFEGIYKVSNLGNVLSLNFKRSGKAKLLKPCVNGEGYYNITLRKNMKSYTKTIHVLVAEAFLNKSDSSFQVNHIDGIKLNNIYSNLEWCSSGDNTRHMVRIGLRDTSRNACKNK